MFGKNRPTLKKCKLSLVRSSLTPEAVVTTPNFTFFYDGSAEGQGTKILRSGGKIETRTPDQLTWRPWFPINLRFNPSIFRHVRRFIVLTNYVATFSPLLVKLQEFALAPRLCSFPSNRSVLTWWLMSVPLALTSTDFSVLPRYFFIMDPWNQRDAMGSSGMIWSIVGNIID